MMKSPLLMLIALSCLCAIMCSRTREIPKDTESADVLFIQGKFEEARNIYNLLLSADPDNCHILTQLGHIALLSNHLEDAEGSLQQVLELDTTANFAVSLLAEVYYRKDDFTQAAPLLEKMGKEVKARKYASYRDKIPYEIAGTTESTVIPFVIEEPLPVVEVQINGSKKVNFLIDTGGSELVIDTELAKKVGATVFGDEMGTFAGGKKALYQHGSVDSIKLSTFTVRNVPVHIQNVREFSSPIFGEVSIDGIIGTVFLYHFISTLDYPNGKLILQRKTETNLNQLKEHQVNCISIPFWMAVDHYMVAWGTVNGSTPLLFFVDTGMAGGGFTCPESTIKKAKIELREDQAGEGMGAGGKVRVIPFVVNQLTLGDAKESNIGGLFVEEFVLEDAFGFTIGGLISHGFFKHYSITMDFGNMKYSLQREGSAE
jgi:predicted aspartyl protease